MARRSYTVNRPEQTPAVARNGNGSKVKELPVDGAKTGLAKAEEIREMSPLRTPDASKGKMAFEQSKDARFFSTATEFFSIL